MIQNLKYIILLLLITAYSAIIKSQNYIDSLESILPTLEDEKKVSAYIDLAYEYEAINENDLAQEKANMALILSDKVNNMKEKGNAFNLLSLIAIKKGELNTGLNNAEKAIKIGTEINNISILEMGYNYLGYVYFSKSDFQKALKSWQESLKYSRQRNNKEKIAELLYNIGLIYKNWSEYNDAIEYYEEALAIYQELKSDYGMAQIFVNLGNLYFYSGIDFENALVNYQKALAVYREKGLKNQEALLLISIGLVLEKRQLYEDAIKKYREGLKIAEETNDEYTKAQALNNIGKIYLLRKDFNNASDLLNESLSILEKLERKKDIALILKDIGLLYHQWGKNQEAKNFYLKSITLCRELDLLKELSDNYRELSLVLAELNDYKNAYKYHQLYAQQNDSIFSNEYKDMITEWNARLETAEKEAALVEKENEILAQEAALKRKNLIVYAAIGGILIVLVFSSLLYKQFREKKKANILLQDQNEEIKSQRDKIFEQNKEITDSIEYASKIQTAMLPPENYISDILPDYFILYRPRDIVSGDFYWINKYNNKIFLCAADCTGHGVPGAFMSMLGIALLNEIINKRNNYTAADILNNLRTQVVNSMHQRDLENETQDGMDIAFCIIDQNDKKIQFAGAFNPLFIFRNGELIEIKGDKMPIGIHIRQDTPFTNHDFDIENGDHIYVFSDGYVDQFGGPNRKKFLVKRFKELLMTLQDKTMKEQKALLENTIDEWIGPYDQIDDILVFGAKII